MEWSWVLTGQVKKLKIKKSGWFSKKTRIVLVNSSIILTK